MKGTVQTNLRIRPELLDRLKQVAEENGRTLSSEISLRLEQSFQPSEPAAVLQQIADASKVLAEAGAKLAGGPGERVLQMLQEGRIRTVTLDENPNPYAEVDRRARTKKERVK